MLIKICGLRELEHAQKTAEMGADFLGFVFAQSPRKVSPEQVRAIIQRLPQTSGKVGVFVDENSTVVNEIVSFCGLDMVQLHGKETPEYCGKILCPVIKGFRVKDKNSLDEMEPYRDRVEMFLLDTYVPGVTGGTGKTFDWSLAGLAAKYGKVLLAGGLSVDNVDSAIEMVHPYGIDVSGGVETNGSKDLVKIGLFIEQARRSQNVHIT